VVTILKTMWVIFLLWNPFVLLSVEVHRIVTGLGTILVKKGSLRI